MRSWVERSKSQAKALCVLGGRGEGGRLQMNRINQKVEK